MLPDGTKPLPVWNKTKFGSQDRLITWATIDRDLCYHMVSLGHKGLKYAIFPLPGLQWSPHLLVLPIRGSPMCHFSLLPSWGHPMSLSYISSPLCGEDGSQLCWLHRVNKCDVIWRWNERLYQNHLLTQTFYISSRLFSLCHVLWTLITFVYQIPSSTVMAGVFILWFILIQACLLYFCCFVVLYLIVKRCANEDTCLYIQVEDRNLPVVHVTSLSSICS